MKMNIKMRVSPKQSKDIQKICFEYGLTWDGSKTYYHLDKPFLYIYEFALSYDDIHSERYFRNHENQEIDADLFIRTNGIC